MSWLAITMEIVQWGAILFVGIAAWDALDVGNVALDAVIAVRRKIGDGDYDEGNETEPDHVV